ncbi:MAG: 3-deoxy-D-manno-octulosonic acid transferase, partial [Alphaproteobacteria bacterium]
MSGLLYRCAAEAAAPLIAVLLKRRRAAGKEDATRFEERRGIASLPRPNGPLVWIHAASVGEAVSMLSIAERLPPHLLVTTGTVTSARLLAQRLPDGALHQYVPVDRIAWVRRFLDHWRPDLALWMESELWPNLVGETRRRGVPMVLLNARMSERSYRRWRWAPGLARDLLAGFALCLAQSETAAARLAALGAVNVKTAGNLKFAAAALPADETELARLGPAFADRPRWLAVSTHPGEEVLAGTVHRALAARRPALLTVIVPRHPSRGPEVANALRAQGHAVALRSAGETVMPATAIYVADGMGELGLFFRLVDTVFVGGSLVPHGGH